jgi:hypothetical protein
MSDTAAPRSIISLRLQPLFHRPVVTLNLTPLIIPHKLKHNGLSGG